MKQTTKKIFNGWFWLFAFFVIASMTAIGFYQAYPLDYPGILSFSISFSICAAITYTKYYNECRKKELGDD